MIFSNRTEYAVAIFSDPDSSLQDLTSAVETLESVSRVRQRVFGSGYRNTYEAQIDLKEARAVLAERRAHLRARDLHLRARETPS